MARKVRSRATPASRGASLALAAVLVALATLAAPGAAAPPPTAVPTPAASPAPAVAAPPIAGGATAVPPTVDPAAVALLARFKAVTGGEAWDAVKAVHTTGILATGGLRGPFETWEELATGRGTSRYKLGPVEAAEGFDGEAPWTRDPSGEVVFERSPEALEAARDEAYRTAMAWWYPQRWPAAMRVLGERREVERRFDVVEITPRGGRPFELWLDHETGLAERAVERGGIETTVATFADWRPVGAVRLPFHVRAGTGDARYDTTMVATAIELDPPLDPALFVAPRSRARDFSIAGGAASATLPFTFSGNHVYVEAEIDGHGPFTMLLDSGGFNVLTPEVAKRLGLRGQGALQGRGVGEGTTDVALAHVGRVALGPVDMRDQVFYLLPLTAIQESEGKPVAGILGFELLQRFAVEIDYARRRLTFTLPDHFDARDAGTEIPFVFADHMPAVEGSVDGIPGRFTVDTGSRGMLALHRPFVEEHGLVARYRPRIAATTGWGVGGAVRAQVTRVGALRLGSIEVPRPVTELVQAEKGAFADRYLAGNVGGGVLRRFRVTFDYRHERLFLAPGPDAATPVPFDRAGLWLELRDGALVVEDVVPGAPGADADIFPGDRVLGLVDAPHDETALAALRDRLRTAPAGTTLRLRIAGMDGVREVSLELIDLDGGAAAPPPSR